MPSPTLAGRSGGGPREKSQNGFFSITPIQFAQLLQSMGLQVKTACLTSNVDQRCAFTDRSRVFRVRGLAKVGAVEKSIEAVVTFDPGQPGAQAGQLGRLLHWREE